VATPMHYNNDVVDGVHNGYSNDGAQEMTTMNDGKGT
jgi:hypothetical protein